MKKYVIPDAGGTGAISKYVEANRDARQAIESARYRCVLPRGERAWPTAPILEMALLRIEQ